MDPERMPVLVVFGVQKLVSLTLESLGQTVDGLLQGELRASGFGLDDERASAPDASDELYDVVVVLVIENGTDTSHPLVEL
jgi:hypothetical protein